MAKQWLVYGNSLWKERCDRSCGYISVTAVIIASRPTNWESSPSNRIMMKNSTAHNCGHGINATALKKCNLSVLVNSHGILPWISNKCKARSTLSHVGNVHFSLICHVPKNAVSRVRLSLSLNSRNTWIWRSRRRMMFPSWMPRGPKRLCRCRFCTCYSSPTR